MRAIKTKSEQSFGIGKFAGATFFATLISIVILVVLCALLSFISLKAMIYPSAETILCYIIYGICGVVCGYINALEIDRFGIVSGVVGGVMLGLVLYIGGVLLDGRVIEFMGMIKMLGILGGCGALGGIVRMYIKK